MIVVSFAATKQDIPFIHPSITPPMTEWSIRTYVIDDALEGGEDLLRSPDAMRVSGYFSRRMRLTFATYIYH